MKITVTLSDAQERGIKNYLADLEGSQRKITRVDICEYIQGVVDTTLDAEAVSSYIQEEINS